MNNDLEGHLRAAISNMHPNEVSLDGQELWGSASVQGQFEKDDSWKLSNIKVDVFDLSKAPDRKKYETLLASNIKEEPSSVILEQDKRFCETNSTWKVFVVSGAITYKKLTGTPRGPSDNE